jgi:hypothetical protein
MCDEPPVPMPSWSPQDYALTAAGQITPVFTQTVLHLAWWQLCQCSSEPTPSPPRAPGGAGLPLVPTQPGLPCSSYVGQLAPMTQPIAIIIPDGNQNGGFVPLPPGATHVRYRAHIDSLGSVAPTQRRDFKTNTNRATGGPGLGMPLFSITPPALDGEVVLELEPGLISFQVEHSVNTFFTQLATGNSVTLNADVFCGGPPGYAQPECCPPDPAIINLLNDLSLQVALLVARAGPTGPLEQLLTSPISGEGSLNLELGTRQVLLELSALGPGTKFVPYANPDRLMRAGTIRWGNDFGWSRRLHVDSTRCIFPVPPDSNVVSWSISPGSAGQITQLGEPR